MNKKILTKQALRSRLVMTGLILCGLISGCSEKSDDNKAGGANLAGVQNSKAEELKMVKQNLLSDGKLIGELIKTELSPEDIAAQKSTYEMVSVTDVPIGAEFNTQVFSIAGPNNFEKAYLAPKVFVYGTLEGHATVIENNDGTVTVPFNIAMTSGLNELIPSVQGGSAASIKIPDNLKVRNIEKLKSVVAEKVSSRAVLSPISGCPKKIYISAAGKTYDATPLLFKEGDICEIEKPFAVNVKIPKHELLNLYDAIDQGYADVHVRFDTRVPVTTAAVSVEFSRQRLYESIHAKLNAVYKAWAQAEVEMAIQKILTESQMNVFIVGEQTEQTKKIIDSIVAEFFQPFAKDPSVSESASCKAVVCLSLKVIQNNETRSFKLSWKQTAPYLVDMKFISMAKLQSANETPYTVGGQQIPFTNHSSAGPNTLALTPSLGDLIFVKPLDYVYENRRVAVENADIELETNRTKTRECDEWVFGSCKGWTDKWDYYYTRSVAANTQFVKIETPVSQAPNLFNGIVFNFKFNNYETISCPLTSMHGKGIQEGRIVKIANSEACPLFNENRTKIISVSISNRIVHPAITYYTGGRHHSNYRGASNNYVLTSYHPEVRLTLELRHRTRVLTSSESQTILK